MPAERPQPLFKLVEMQKWLAKVQLERRVGEIDPLSKFGF